MMENYKINCQQLGKDCFSKVYMLKGNISGNQLIVKIFENPRHKYYIKEKEILDHINDRKNLFDYKNNFYVMYKEINYNPNMFIIPNEVENSKLRFLFFDYLSNFSLFDYLCSDKEKLEEIHIKYLCYELLNAIKNLHKINISHNKLDIFHIMFDDNYELKIIHFCESELINSDDKSKVRFNKDLYDVGKILAKLISLGHFKSINFNKKKNYFEIQTCSDNKSKKESLFWEMLRRYDIKISDEFLHFIHNLFDSILKAKDSKTILNIDQFLESDWLNEIRTDYETNQINFKNDLKKLSSSFLENIEKKDTFNIDINKIIDINPQPKNVSSSGLFAICKDENYLSGDRLPENYTEKNSKPLNFESTSLYKPNEILPRNMNINNNHNINNYYTYNNMVNNKMNMNMMMNNMNNNINNKLINNNNMFNNNMNLMNNINMMNNMNTYNIDNNMINNKMNMNMMNNMNNNINNNMNLLNNMNMTNNNINNNMNLMDNMNMTNNMNNNINNDMNLMNNMNMTNNMNNNINNNMNMMNNMNNYNTNYNMINNNMNMMKNINNYYTNNNVINNNMNMRISNNMMMSNNMNNFNINNNINYNFNNICSNKISINDRVPNLSLLNSEFLNINNIGIGENDKYPRKFYFNNFEINIKNNENKDIDQALNILIEKFKTEIKNYYSLEKINIYIRDDSNTSFIIIYQIPRPSLYDDEIIYLDEEYENKLKDGQNFGIKIEFIKDNSSNTFNNTNIYKYYLIFKSALIDKEDYFIYLGKLKGIIKSVIDKYN